MCIFGSKFQRIIFRISTGLRIDQNGIACGQTSAAFGRDLCLTKRRKTLNEAATGIASKAPMKPNSAPKANGANIIQTGLRLTRRPMRCGDSIALLARRVRFRAVMKWITTTGMRRKVVIRGSPYECRLRVIISGSAEVRFYSDSIRNIAAAITMGSQMLAFHTSLLPAAAFSMVAPAIPFVRLYRLLPHASPDGLSSLEIPGLYVAART